MDALSSLEVSLTLWARSGDHLCLQLHGADCPFCRDNVLVWTPDFAQCIFFPLVAAVGFKAVSQVGPHYGTPSAIWEVPAVCDCLER